MRIATYNVEWFSSLFGDDNTLLNDDGPSGRHGISRSIQTAALAKVFRSIDADALLLVEAPDQSPSRSTLGALQNFVSFAGLRTTQAVIGYANDTRQEIAFLYDPTRLTARHAPAGAPAGAKGAAGAPRFDTALRIDLDIDGRADRVVFSKPPLELDIQTAGGLAFHLIGAHLKSKAPHGATTPEQVTRLAIANRRKQLAQAIWLRARIDARLAEGTPLMVLGDLNDGPGLDNFETLFGRSSVEIVLGEGAVALHDPHARRALAGRLSATPTTARFWIGPEKRYLQALLDYIMVSPGLRARAAGWRIWHPFDDPACWQDVGLRDALLAASDHFPVTLDFEDGATVL